FGRGYSRAAPAPQSRYKDVFMSAGSEPGVGAPNQRSKPALIPGEGRPTGSVRVQEKFQLEPDDDVGWAIASLRELAKAENECRRCPLYKHATQAVPGEGREGAHLMLVGEQPGDKEDLAGKPFVGPAGRVLDQAL